MPDSARLPEFERDLEQLLKRFPRAEKDLEEALGKVLKGQAPIFPIPGYPGLVKFRIASADLNKGKSGGFRAIYHRDGDRVCLCAIWAKSDYEDLSPGEFKALIKRVRRRQEESGD